MRGKLVHNAMDFFLRLLPHSCQQALLDVLFILTEEKEKDLNTCLSLEFSTSKSDQYLILINKKIKRDSVKRDFQTKKVQRLDGGAMLAIASNIPGNFFSISCFTALVNCWISLCGLATSMDFDADVIKHSFMDSGFLSSILTTANRRK